ncbi:MAG: protein kinase [Acidobacteriota bacterium]
MTQDRSPFDPHPDGAVDPRADGIPSGGDDDLPDTVHGPLGGSPFLTPAAFGPDDVIAGRYRVVRFIARGGIGEVYEVIDRDLGEHLALKTLQPQAHQEIHQERFRREIQLARRVTHRHVCRLFDAGVHQVEGQPPRHYLTMELLDGECLDERIDRLGSMSPEQTLPMVRQLAAALDAAHDAGVVHRDFKTGNVMLVPDPDGGERVVVTDFGLARAMSRDDPAQSDPSVFRTVTTDSITGTLAFMAPEQFEDAECTPATDVYALGVVLYQMLTGEVPFHATSAIVSAVQRLQQPAPSPKLRVPDLDPRWEATVLRCLEVDPMDRFQRAGEVLRALDGGTATAPPSERRRRRARWRRLASAGAAAFAAAALGAAVWHSASEPQPPPRPAGDDPIQMTTHPGLEIDPAFAPSGDRIAFAANRGGGFEIYLRPAEPGGRETQLTDDGRQNMQPVFSPDGARIAYVVQDPGGLWLTAVRKGTPRQLTNFGSSPSWSPSGDALAFQGDGRREVSERALPAMPPSTLWRVGIDGSEPQRITRPGEPAGGHGEPAWSPDGRRIAFSAGNRRRTEIWTVDVDGGEVTPLVSQSRVNKNPVWSADGRGLFYIGISSSGRQSAAYAVWYVAVDDSGAVVGEPSRISDLGLATIRQLALSPSGDRLVFAALSTVSHLEQLPLDSAGRASAAAESLVRQGQRSSRPRFSHDGARLAFDRWQIGTNLDIWTVDLEAPGAEPYAVTHDPEWDSQATWLADDRGLAYFSERAGKRGIWQLELTTGESTFLADIGNDADWAQLSPDGTQVAFHSARGGHTLDVWRQDLASGETRRLTEDPEMAGFPIWSPDGSTLAIEVRRGQSTQVAVLPAEGGTPRVLTDAPGESWPFSWDPEGERIAFAGRRNGFWNLFWVRVDDAEVVQLTEDRRLDGYVRYPAWSPLGDRMVFENARTVGDLWRVDLHPHGDGQMPSP